MFYNISFIVSAVCMSLEVTVSLYTFCAIFLSTTSEYSLILPPLGHSILLSVWQCVFHSGALDGSTMWLFSPLLPKHRSFIVFATFFSNYYFPIIVFVSVY